MNRYLAKLFVALIFFSAFNSCLSQESLADDASVPRVVAQGQQRKAASVRFLAHRGMSAPASQNASQGTAGAAERARLLVAARSHSAQLAVAQPAAAGTSSLGNTWQAIGPMQVVNPTFGNVTGRVTSIAIDDSDATGNTVYLGTTGGGVWKSTNAVGPAANVSFAPLTDTLPVFSSGSLASLSIGAVSVQPGGTGVLLAGTGDPNDAMDSYYGSGLLRSADRGKTWSLIQGSKDANFGPYSNHTFLGKGFAGFAWSSSSPNLVVAAVSDAAEGDVVGASSNGNTVQGLYYSADAGATWQLATITDGAGQVVQSVQTLYRQYAGNAATAVVWNALRKRFYAAVRFHGYYESVDGVTWTRLANQPGTRLSTVACPANPGAPGSASCPLFRGALAVQPATGDTFAITVDLNNQDQGLWQDNCNLSAGTCASGTVTFGRQISASTLENDSKGTISEGDYSLWLAAVPSQSDTVLYAGTSDIYRCSLAAGCVWRDTTNAATCAAAKVAPSQHAVAVAQSAPQIMFFGNDGGLWRTTDGIGQTGAVCSATDASHFDNLNAGLGSLAEIEDFAQHPSDSTVLMASLGANGTAAVSGGQQAWPQVLGGEGGSVAIDPANPQNWYAESATGVAIHQCTQGSACTQAGFGAVVIGNTQVAGDGTALTTPSRFALDPNDSSQMLVATCRLWRGPANGAAWSMSNAISPMLDGDLGTACNGNAVVRSLAIAATAGSTEQIYLGMAGLLDGGATVPGHVYGVRYSGSSTTAADLWRSPVSNVTGGQFNPGGFDISSVAVDPHDATGQTIYVTVQGFSGNGISAPLIYRSTDAGLHWTSIHSNLPNAPANSVVVDPDDANTVYIALDIGVYVTRQVSGCSTPTVNCWSVYGTGLPNSPVTQLQAFRSGNTAQLRAATYGRGLWQIPLLGAASTQSTAALSPLSLTFADQPVQTRSMAQVITLTNTGSIALTVSQLTTQGDFAETDNCVGSLAAQQSCTIQITFLPTSLGPRSGSLAVFANVAGGQLTAALTGSGVQGAAVVLSPTSLTFGSTPVGTTAPAQNLTISNTGGVAVSPGAAAVVGPFSITANTCGATLAPGYGCTVSVAFTPTTSGPASGTFSITDSAGTQMAQLSGTGLSAATDTLSPLALTFAAQVVNTTSAPQQVTLTNSGDSALTLISATVKGDFSVTNGCGVSLTGHSSCMLSVAYLPTQVGQQAGTLTVTDILRTQTVSLAGAGLAPPGISVTPAQVDFGSVGVNGTGAPQAITLTNNGGVALATPAVSLTGDFSVTGNNCTASLAVGSSCSLQVAFSPQQAGARTGSLTVASATLAVPVAVAMGGVGADFQFAVIGSSSATLTSGQTAGFQLQIIPVSGSSGTVTFACSGAPKNATCSVSPASQALVSGATGFVTVQVTTGSLPKGSVAHRSSIPPGRAWGLGFLLPVGLLAAFRRRSRCLQSLALAVCIAVAGVCGCGVTVNGGQQSGPTPAAPPEATPAGKYTLTVTGSMPGLERTTTFTLTVE